MVRKRTETVCKWCKYGICLQQAGFVLCPCVRAIFPVQLMHQLQLEQERGRNRACNYVHLLAADEHSNGEQDVHEAEEA